MGTTYNPSSTLRAYSDTPVMTAVNSGGLVLASLLPATFSRSFQRLATPSAALASLVLTSNAAQ